MSAFRHLFSAVVVLWGLAGGVPVMGFDDDAAAEKKPAKEAIIEGKTLLAKAVSHGDLAELTKAKSLF